MKKFLILLLCMIFSLGMFAGCNNGGENSGENGGDGGNGGNDGSGGDTPAEVTYETYGSYWMPQHDYMTMPVAAYNSNPPQLSDFTYNYLTSESTFAAYQEAGVNTMMGLKEYVGSEEVLQALDWCEDYGLAYLVPLGGAESLVSDTTARSALSRVKYHDAFAGIMQSDEPGYTLFESIARAAEILDSIMPDGSENLLWHVNLFPTYATEKQLYFRWYTDSSEIPGGSYTYEQYIEDYMEIVQPKVLSYDYYPVSGHGDDLTSGYFENMSIIREAAMEANIPFWVFVETCSFNSANRVPDEADLLWQVNTALSYGAKGIQYFTGVLPSDGAEIFTGAMFDRDGNRTEVYDYVKRANTQIKAVDEVLMCSISKGIIVTGTSPWGTESYIPEQDILSTYGSIASIAAAHVITGCFDYNGAEAYYVTNNSVVAEDSVTVTFSSEVTGYAVLGGVKTQFSGTSVTIPLDMGEGALIVLE